MIIIPAIDLQNGEAVRLYKGDYAQKTVYSQDPPALAAGFEEMGAKYLHIVDLDGAKQGNVENLKTIQAIRRRVKLPIQVGGGIRSAETVDMYLNEIKIDRVILGTAAVSRPEFVREMIDKHGAERIVAGVDARNGQVSVAGWLSDSGVDYLTFIKELAKLGARYFVVTDIGKDGTLTSPSWEMYENIRHSDPSLNIIVSGGVSGEGDIEHAADYYGVIVGKAYYEGRVDLARCIQAYSRNN